VLSLPPLGLYVHLPWCERKCPYCDFNSHAIGEGAPFADYTARLLEDLAQERPWIEGREIGTVFFGGGTPSLFPGACIAALLQGIRDRLDLAAGAEVTLEANPGSAEAAKFRELREAGVNRLSIGVQSFDDRALGVLGRVHDAREAHCAIEQAQAAGFAEINIDLMHGLPGQDAIAARRDLELALAHETTHLSWYQLTIEPNTRFHSAPPSLPTEEQLEEIQAQGEQLLAQAGLSQYEVSAYSRPGHSCRHNLNYWRFGDYLGIGAGAHGKLSRVQDGAVLRTSRTRSPRDYLAGDVATVRQVRAVAEAELPLEFLMNALRLRSGTTVEHFESRTGIDFERIAPGVERLRAAGLLEAEPALLRATATGYRFLDSVLAEFG
jgi:oxygen-independent coproporphyrinogen-3 oxidase